MSDAVDAFVKASCAVCGAVQVPAAEATLHVVAKGSEDRRSLASFRCPTCSRLVEKRVDERTAGLLLTAGVAVDMPAQLPSQTDRS